MGELGDNSVEFHRQAGEMARDYGLERLFALGTLTQHAVEGFGNGASHFASAEELLDVINRNLSANVTVLVKGSRRMAMDRIVNSLTGGG